MISSEDVVLLEKQFKLFEEEKKWPIIYHEIRSSAQQHSFSDKAAKLMANRALNRYRDVNPYDHSRVQLQPPACCAHNSSSSSSESEAPVTVFSDYINASLVEVSAAARRYIMTQGPLPNTTPHFWLMVWQQRSSIIVMLNRVIEKNQIKCHQYWPVSTSPHDEHLMQLSEVGLSVRCDEVLHCGHYSVTTLTLTELESGESRCIRHFHYTAWPDFGIPQSPAAFLSFLHAVRSSGGLASAPSSPSSSDRPPPTTSQQQGPAVVHCSAGIGRTGTFCLVDSFLVMLERGCVAGESVQDVLVDMRRYRMGLIQTVDQLQFSYQAIVHAARSLLNCGQLCDMSNGGEASLSSSPALSDGQYLNGTSVASDFTAPPRPPARAASLSGQSVSETASQQGESGVGFESDASCLSTSPAPPLPPRLTKPPSTTTTTTTTDIKHDNNTQQLSDLAQGSSELQQRRARRQRLQHQLQLIKHKQLQHELWQRRRQQLLPLSYTVAAVGVAVLGYLLACKWLHG